MPHALKLKNTTQTLSLLYLFPSNFYGFDDGNKACGASTVTLPLSLSLSPGSVSLVSFNLQFSSSYSHQLSGLEGKNGNPTPILKISKPRLNSKTPGLALVCPGRPFSGSTGFRLANSLAGFYLDPDRSQTRVGRVPGQLAGPVRVLKLWPNLLLRSRDPDNPIKIK